MSRLELEKQPFTTNNPGELARHLRRVIETDSTLTVSQALEKHVSPGHDISGVWLAFESAGFPTEELREYFSGSKLPPGDGSM